MKSEASETTGMVSALVVDERSQPMADQELKLTPEEAVALLSKEEKPTLEFLNKLSAAIYYSDPNRQTNPVRPQQLIDKLVECCDADSWGDEAKSQFADALAFPLRGIYQFDRIYSVPALLALFKQFSLSDTMKNMCFLQTPAESVRNYASTVEPYQRSAVVKTAKSDVGLFSLQDCDKPQSELSKKAIPFIQCSGILAAKMNKDQSEELLRLLINDKALHQRIPDLIWHRATTDEVLDGYIKPYLDVMLDPNADPELEKILSPFGGVLMERMNREQFSELLKSLYINQRNDQLQALLLKCRESKKLNPEIIEVLSPYFTALSQCDSALSMALFPSAFAHLCGQLVPAMSEEQRRTVLSDPLVQISVSLIQSLNNPAPLALSSECVRILVLRSAVECIPALRHLIKILEEQNQHDGIVSMFTEYSQDPEGGALLKGILLKDYFLHFLTLLVSRGVSVTDLLETVLRVSGNNEQLERVILALVSGCKNRESASQYAVVTRQLFENSKLHDRLFTLNEKTRLFTSVVDSFTDLDQAILKPIIDVIFAEGNLTEPLVQLLSVFTGNRVVHLRTNDMNRNAYNGCFHEQNVTYLLEQASTIPAYKDEILRMGPTFILYCCQVNKTESVAVLERYLEFGCRPSPKDCEGGDAEMSLANPFHLAAIHRSIPMLALLLPHQKRIGKVMLGLMIRVETIVTIFSKEAFELVFNTALEKNRDSIEKCEFGALYSKFSFPIGATLTRPLLGAYLLMIEAGITPGALDLQHVAKYVVQQDAEFLLQFTRVLCNKALRSYLFCLKALYEKGETDLTSAFLPRELFPSVHDQGGAQFEYEALFERKGLVPFTNHGEAFITAVEVGLGVKTNIEPAQAKAIVSATTSEPQFFGGDSSALRAQAPLKRAVLARSPAKAVAQPQGATQPQSFGGSSDAQGAELEARSPVKAAAQPPVTTELQFFGGVPVVSPAQAPLKRAVLISRAPAAVSPAQGLLKRTVLSSKATAAVSLEAQSDETQSTFGAGCK